ncbi:MAG: sulfurtransferase [Alphaproteobacteria bacterium]
MAEHQGATEGATEPAIVSVNWLKQNLDKVVILDASFYLPAMNKDADEEFAKAHIPNALRWDIDKIARPSVSGLPHMMPPAMQIVQEAEHRGINHNTHVVVYDQLGVFSSPRMWFTLKTIGHEKVSVLNGGLPAWVKAGFETHSGDATECEPKSYVLDAKPGRLATCNLKTMICSLEREDTLIMDARPAARFQGKAAEPRPGLKSGHMPHSKSLHSLLCV